MVATIIVIQYDPLLLHGMSNLLQYPQKSVDTGWDIGEPCSEAETDDKEEELHTVESMEMEKEAENQNSLTPKKPSRNASMEVQIGTPSWKSASSQAQVLDDIHTAIIDSVEDTL